MACSLNVDLLHIFVNVWLTRTGIVHGSIFLKILLLLYPYQLSSDQISTVAFNVCLTLNTYFTCTKDLYYCTVNSDRFLCFRNKQLWFLTKCVHVYPGLRTHVSKCEDS